MAYKKLSRDKSFLELKRENDARQLTNKHFEVAWHLYDSIIESFKKPFDGAYEFSSVLINIGTSFYKDDKTLAYIHEVQDSEASSIRAKYLDEVSKNLASRGAFINDLSKAAFSKTLERDNGKELLIKMCENKYAEVDRAAFCNENFIDNFVLKVKDFNKGIEDLQKFSFEPTSKAYYDSHVKQKDYKDWNSESEAVVSNDIEIAHKFTKAFHNSLNINFKGNNQTNTKLTGFSYAFPEFIRGGDKANKLICQQTGSNDKSFFDKVESDLNSYPQLYNNTYSITSLKRVTENDVALEDWKDRCEEGNPEDPGVSNICSKEFAEFVVSFYETGSTEQFATGGNCTQFHNGGESWD